MASPFSRASEDAVSKAMNDSDEVDGIVDAFSGLVSSNSMDLRNDPRLFADNVLNKRLAAFSALAGVSTMMTAICGAQVLGLKKDIQLDTIDGWVQLCGLVLMNFVLFTNIAATYVGVAQHYFAYRLMTGGSTGYEMAARFYLDPNISFWRHTTIKGMMISMPSFLVAAGLRLLVCFDQDMPFAPAKFQDSNYWSTTRIAGISGLGLVIITFWIGMLMVLCYMDNRHRQTFTQCYQQCKDLERPLLRTTDARAQSDHMPMI